MEYKYPFTHSFGRYDEVLNGYFLGLIKKSYQFFINQVNSGKIIIRPSDTPQTKNIEFKKVANIIRKEEDYLYYCYKKEPKNFKQILQTITSRVTVVGVLPENERGNYGITNNDTKTGGYAVLVNPDLGKSETLSSDERIRLYTAHELGHVINAQWNQSIIAYLNSLKISGNIEQVKEIKINILKGFQMINEVTTQERAEDIAYYFSNKKRPSFTRVSDRRGMYPGLTYTENFDWYGELQNPATAFARTLRGIGKLKKDEEALSALARRSLSPKFVEDIVTEYRTDNQEKNLPILLYYMGILKEASYARFGHGERNALKESSKAIQELNKLAGQLRDYRDSFNETNDKD